MKNMVQSISRNKQVAQKLGHDAPARKGEDAMDPKLESVSKLKASQEFTSPPALPRQITPRTQLHLSPHQRSLLQQRVACHAKRENADERARALMTKWLEVDPTTWFPPTPANVAPSGNFDSEESMHSVVQLNQLGRIPLRSQDLIDLGEGKPLAPRPNAQGVLRWKNPMGIYRGK
jgi:hypothetical protein